MLGVSKSFGLKKYVTVVYQKSRLTNYWELRAELAEIGECQCEWLTAAWPGVGAAARGR